MSRSPTPAAAAPSSPSAFRAWCVLVVQSFQRHWRVRQMGLVAGGLLALVVVWVAFATQRGAWDVTQLRSRRTVSTLYERPPVGAEAARQSRDARYAVLADGERIAEQPAHELPNPLNPTADSFATLILSVPHAAMTSEPFARSWGFMNYSRYVVLLVFMGFVLPLFTLSYATGAFGADRESRSLVWLMTRPLPRGGIYLAKLLGTLPWCLAFGLGGLALVCAAGGQVGRDAFALYWPAAAAGTVAFAALFHLVGALFRRPVVIGLVYVFFFETVVAALPGSLKLLSLTFYARSVMYNEAVAAGHPGEMLPAITAQAVSSETAWAVLMAAPVVVTLLGMWLFARFEYRDDV